MLKDYNQFILCRVAQDGRKLPCDPHGKTADAHNPANWLSYNEACKQAEKQGCAIGFVLTDNDPFFCVDIDNCLMPDGKDWNPLSKEICAKFPGAMVEVSQSGKGLHIWGSYSAIPPHSCKNTKLGLELYQDKRFIILGKDQKGTPDTDQTKALENFICKYMATGRNDGPAQTEWRGSPDPEWSGPEDDNELIALACKSASPASIFGNKASFSDLWQGDTEALSRAFPDHSGARAYDASSADMSLAQRLAYYTGKNCERIERLMRQSALKRDKWERPDYLPRTIQNACGQQEKVFTDRSAKSNPEMSGAESKAQHALNIINPTGWQGCAIPSRRWIVKNWLPYSHVTALYGDGGTGKSLLAMMLATAAALGKTWLGVPIEQIKVLGFFCEDTQDELQRRQALINKAYDCDFSDLENLRMISGVGENNILMDFPKDGTGNFTELYNKITEAARDFGAQLVIIDTAADTFGGNENNRGQVRQFINGLNKLALEIDGAVLLCAHPSVAGMASGRGDGGNTAWNNSVRSRLYLTRPQFEDGAPFDPDVRILSRKKSNYDRTGGDDMILKWQDGVFAPQTPSNGLGVIDNTERHKHADAAFLRALDDFEAQGRNLSSSNRSGNYAPKKMIFNTHCRGFNKRELEQAMERLFDSGRIRDENYGRSSNQSRKIAKIPDSEATS